VAATAVPRTAAKRRVGRTESVRVMGLIGGYPFLAPVSIGG
jgi:hypothetical protein